VVSARTQLVGAVPSPVYDAFGGTKALMVAVRWRQRSKDTDMRTVILALLVGLAGCDELPPPRTAYSPHPR
jgi:hypothetical protein